MPPRAAGAAAPPRSASPTVAVVVAIVAAALGFFILKQVSDSGGSGGGTGTGTTKPSTATTKPSTGTTATTTAVTNPGTVDKSTFSVVTANASGVGGAAGKLTTQLQQRGYKTVKAANVTAGTPQQATTIVYYEPGFEQAGAMVAAELGKPGTAQPAPAAGVPISAADRGGAQVVIILGKDLAGKTLPAVTATTAASNITLPAGGGSPNSSTGG